MDISWRTASEHRASGLDVAEHIPDGQIVRYVYGVDPDGEPLRRLETRPFKTPMSEIDAHERMVLGAITGWGLAVRNRYPLCRGTASCGGTCNLFDGHRGACLCEGTEGGEEQCPA